MHAREGDIIKLIVSSFGWCSRFRGQSGNHTTEGAREEIGHGIQALLGLPD